LNLFNLGTRKTIFDEFEAQSNMNNVALNIKAQLKERITERRVIMQQFRNLKDLSVS
jgi:uncharacterized membrane-anchored protein